MYGNSVSQFFRTTTAKQSGPDTFAESRFVMTFLTILGVTGKTGKDILESSRLEFLGMFLANNFALSDGEVNTLNRGGIADLSSLRTLLAICQKSGELIFWEVFGSFKNRFATSSSLSELSFKF